MKILALGQEYHVDKTQDNVVEYILSIIKAIMAEKNMIFCGMRIDGREIYSDFEEEIEEEIESIEMIEPILLTEEQLSKDTLISIHEYVTRSLVHLPQLAERFHSEMISTDTWEELGQLVEGLLWIQNTVQYYPIYNDIFTFSNELETINTAVNQQDTYMIGDVVEYEIIPRYKMIEKQLEDICIHEVDSNGTN
ncbi:hypothetical protein HPY27_13010 [Brevibacillus sp. HB1.1]|uniref:hypothetical protein n=1 Tax=Brevibacillus sp. HB1.1 TaxID=2738808 RepID=UPI001575EA01|nr:hypothetical protein [Brevibacillus sp. HB1.1]NTU31068.1 hypothetical protein [Brevibacillus sp. HB1.1]